MESAYIFGLLCSDGHVTDGGNVGFVSLDRDLSEYVQSRIGGVIKIEHTKAGREVFRVNLQSTATRDWLLTLGFTPRKSLTLCWPVIPPEYYVQFVRGVMDGDGWVDKAGRIGFSTGSDAFAAGLIAWLEGIGLHPRSGHNRRSWRIYLPVSDSTALGNLMFGCVPGMHFQVAFRMNRKASRIHF